MSDSELVLEILKQIPELAQTINKMIRELS